MTFPLRFDKVAINTGNAQKHSHGDAVDEVKSEQAGIMQGYGHTYGSSKSAPETDPRLLRRD